MVKFVTDVFSEDEANIVAFGVDCPESLREASQLVEPFDVTEQCNFLENARIFDAGDVSMTEVGPKVKDILGKGKIPLTLAKEHVATLHTMKSMPVGTRLVVFDAHPDLKDKYEGSKFSHACWLRRWCEAVGCASVAVVGVRACDEDELEFMKNNGMLYITAEEVKNKAGNVVQSLREFASGFNVYVSIDMDVFDPSIAPAVKYPEPAGVLYSDFIQLADALKECKVVGMDCTEIRPMVGNKLTEFLAVKSIFKILSHL